MKKKDFIKAAEKKEHLQTHMQHSRKIGSKALKHISEQNILDILHCFDQAYAKLIDEQGNPGRQEFCLKTNSPVGTDAIVRADEIAEGSAFEVVRGLGTPYAGKVKVALINKKDMPTTNIVHGIYGPYGNSGKAGIYMMTFGQPEVPLPKDLGKNETEQTQIFNQECAKFWNGENGKNGHVYLATPDELMSTIAEMKSYGLKTKVLELRLEAFFRGGEKSPLKEEHRPSQKSKNAVDLGMLPLNSGRDKSFIR